MNTIKNLELIFKNQAGKNATIVIPLPADNVSKPVAEEAMRAIADANLFAKDGLDSHTTLVGARYISKTIEDIFTQDEA